MYIYIYTYVCIPMYIQWEFQDPKMEVLYHIKPYFVGIFPYIGLIYGRYLQSRILKLPLIYIYIHICTRPCHTHTPHKQPPQARIPRIPPHTAGASGAETSPGRCVFFHPSMTLCIYIYIKNARHHQKPYLALNKPIYFG